MSEKRRDNKRRILQKGESQRADGRYMYKYVDLFGKTKYVYSWRLDVKDPYPPDKPRDESLREKEKRIQADLMDEISPDGAGLSVLELADRYINIKKDTVRISTREQYQTVHNTLAREDFGKLRIDRVKQIDVKEWFLKLQKENGLGPSSINNIRGVIRPAFKLAVDNDMIRKNPVDFPLVDVLVSQSKRRDAITPKQMRDFLKFVKEDNYFCRFYEGIYILFHTGLRISEFCGLTTSDIDMENRVIHVDHQIRRLLGTQIYAEKTKTEIGRRDIPMTDDVYQCFKAILKKRNPPKVEPSIDGYVGFLYFDRNGMPLVAIHWERYFRRICDKYNETYKVQMPNITPHVCRHTFCSNMAKSRMNPKVLQKLMGHSSIEITMDVYTHIDTNDVADELKRIESKNAKLYG